MSKSERRKKALLRALWVSTPWPWVRCETTGLRPCPWHPRGGNHPGVGSGA